MDNSLLILHGQTVGGGSSGGGGLTQEEHDALMSIASMPSRGDFNPLKATNNSAYAAIQSNHNGSSLYARGCVNVIGYSKIAMCRTNASGYSATYVFKNDAGNDIGSSASMPSPGNWSSYIDIPSNAVSIDLYIEATSGGVFVSMLTADSPYNPDNQ